MRLLISFFLIGLLSACQNPPDQPPGPSDCQTPPTGSNPIRRLTPTEYDNTIRDLLGDETRIGEATFPPGSEGIGFQISENVSVNMATIYQDAAEGIADRAREVGRLPISCDPATAGTEACAELFIRDFGPRAYRSPISDSQVARLMQVFRSSEQAGDGFDTAVAQVVTAMLQSPYFLYRIEMGLPDPESSGVAPLSSFELASRLSYLLWNTMPDDELIGLAATDALQDPTVLEAQARRMIDHQYARAAVVEFFMQWFELTELHEASKSAVVFPMYDAALVDDLLEETRHYIEDLIWNRDARLESLFTGTHTFVNARLANFYGIEGVRGNAFVEMPLPDERGPGILGQAAFLATQATPTDSSPVLRGLFVRQRLLCQPVSDPPDDLVIVVPDPDPDLTTRERYAAHTEDPTCFSCHQYMDSIGFGFEEYDAVGHFRTHENGHPIDASGEITFTQDIDGEFYGLDGLTSALAESQQVRECVADQWFRYAFARFEDETDTCSSQVLYDSLHESGGDLRELLVALTTTRAFRFRPTITLEN